MAHSFGVIISDFGPSKLSNLLNKVPTSSRTVKLFSLLLREADILPFSVQSAVFSDQMTYKPVVCLLDTGTTGSCILLREHPVIGLFSKTIDFRHDSHAGTLAHLGNDVHILAFLPLIIHLRACKDACFNSKAA